MKRKVKMIRLLILFTCLTLVLGNEENTKKMENNIQEIEQLTASAEKSRRDAIPSTTEQVYDKISSSLSDLIELVDTKNETSIFFQLNGVNRVVIPNIRTTYTPVRTQMLHLVKSLFENDFATTNAHLPINIVDMLLDVFENEDNLALKAHSLDILYLWLPKNAKLQARVMKLKGLEPFYDQISKLDSDVIYKLLDLFNIILEEHLQAKKNKDLKRYDETLKIYQMIGLVERMSTSTVCNGILNIFKEVITYSENSQEIIIPVTKLMKNVKPFCLNLYKGKNTAMEIFKQLHDYFQDSVKSKKFGDGELHVAELVSLLGEYNEKLREHFKDEF